MKRINHTLSLVAALLCIAATHLSLQSCGEDRTYELREATEHNKWVFTTMQDVYLWGDSLTEPTDEKDYFAVADKFLTELMKKGKSDSWSYLTVDTITSDPHIRGNFRHITSYGMDFSLVSDPTGASTKSYLRVQTVYEGSPADRAGLKRGQYILSFDGFKFSTKNTSKMVFGLVSHTLRVAELTGDEDEGVYEFVNEHETVIDPAEYVEDKPYPVCKVLTAGGKKVAYLMCNRLTPNNVEKSDSTSTEYQNLLDEAISKLRADSFDDLVLDLRLCNFGTIEMARRLASYVVDPSCYGKVFAKTIWNDRHSSNNETIMFDESLRTKNIGKQRIFILTSQYTQGAAEWLIRGLRFAMGTDNVVLIGTQTAGQYLQTKFMGYQHLIHLYPAVAFVADGNDDYSYSSGIKPDVESDDSGALNFYDYGENGEKLLNEALNIITQ